MNLLDFYFKIIYFQTKKCTYITYTKIGNNNKLQKKNKNKITSA